MAPINDGLAMYMSVRISICLSLHMSIHMYINMYVHAAAPNDGGTAEGRCRSD